MLLELLSTRGKEDLLFNNSVVSIMELLRTEDFSSIESKSVGLGVLGSSVSVNVGTWILKLWKSVCVGTWEF